MSRVTFCCADSCLANSGGTLETGLFAISGACITELDSSSKHRTDNMRGKRDKNVPFLSSYMTSSSSFVRNVMAVPNLPARPVRPREIALDIDQNHDVGDRRKKKVLRTDSMNIGFNRVCHLVIDDECNVLNIDTTSSKICCNKDVCLAVPERSKGGFSLFLTLPGM